MQAPVLTGGRGADGPSGPSRIEASNKFVFSMIFILAFFACLTLVMVRYA
jgi:hypothetical protein